MSKTTSLELSKQLKEAGAKQESEKVWSKDTERLTDGPCFRTFTMPYAGGFASFATDELLERLPDTTEIVKDHNEIYQVRLKRLASGEYDKIPAEALGKLYLWCLQNGYCEKSEGGS